MNANSNNSKEIRIIQMQILTIRKRFEVFECKFKPLERDLKHLNANSNHSKVIRSIRIQIQTTRKGFEAFEINFEQFEKGFDAFESKFKPFEKDCESKLDPFESDSKLLKANSNHSKRIPCIRMQIRATQNEI